MPTLVVAATRLMFTEQDNKFQPYLILLISVNEITVGAVANHQLPSNTWWER